MPSEAIRIYNFSSLMLKMAASTSDAVDDAEAEAEARFQGYDNNDTYSLQLNNMNYELNGTDTTIQQLRLQQFIS